MKRMIVASPPARCKYCLRQQSPQTLILLYTNRKRCAMITVTAISRQKFIVRGHVDIIGARMAVREFARRCGLNLKGRASISITPTSLVSSLGVTQSLPNGIAMLIEYFDSEHKHGMHVIRTQHHAGSNGHESIKKEISGIHAGWWTTFYWNHPLLSASRLLSRSGILCIKDNP